MNAADGAALAALGDVAARFIEIPYPHVDPDLPAAVYVAAHDKAREAFAELQRERAVRLGGHLGWLARADDDTPMYRRIDIITKIMSKDLTAPLPYPVAPEGGAR